MGGAPAVLAALGSGAVLAAAVLAVVVLCESRPSAGLVGLAGLLLTAAADGLGAGVEGTLPELLLWTAGGVLFARAFEAPAAAFAIPLLVGALAAFGPRPALDVPVAAGDPLLLDLGGAQVPSLVASVFAALVTWGGRLELHPAVPVVLAVVCTAAVGFELQPVTALCSAFVLCCLPDLAGRLRAAGEAGSSRTRRAAPHS